MKLRRAMAATVLTAVVAGCGHQSAPVSTPTSAATSAPASSSTLGATAYPADLAAAVRTRGFDLDQDRGVTPAVGIGAAITASHDFRPPGVPVAIHLALVTTPGFGSLDFSSPSHGSTDLFDRTAAWLVVYHGEEAGQPGTWVVFVDATTGQAQAMVGFGAGLQGGAPCPHNRCIFE